MFDVTSHTVIALVTLVGGFALMIISQVTGRPLSDSDQTLITMIMGTVTGYYFGTRGTLSGIAAGQRGTPADPATPAEVEPAPSEQRTP